MNPPLLHGPVPVHVVTGFLGVGKTTVLRELLYRRPAGESWAVVINEFGEVGLDAALLGREDSPSLRVYEIAGGCACCTGQLTLETLLVRVLKRVKPHRLFLEPTGLGHPAGILDVLRGPNFRELLDVRATVCLVDPRQYFDPRHADNATYRDQIHMADILLASKTDLAGAALTARFAAAAADLYPPKLAVVAETTGPARLQEAWLGWQGETLRAPLFPEAHRGQAHRPHAPKAPQGQVARRRPCRALGERAGVVGCGWIFSHEDVFVRARLLAVLRGLEGVVGPLSRIKGVFRTDSGWCAVQGVCGEWSVTPSAYRRDSRVEMLAATPGDRDWAQVETALLGCLRDDQTAPVLTFATF